MHYRLSRTVPTPTTTGLRRRWASGRFAKILQCVNGALRLFRDIAEFNYLAGIHVMSSSRIDVGRIFAFRESVPRLRLQRRWRNTQCARLFMINVLRTVTQEMGGMIEQGPRRLYTSRVGPHNREFGQYAVFLGGWNQYHSHFRRRISLNHWGPSTYCEIIATIIRSAVIRLYYSNASEPAPLVRFI
jgi:hypothetical protein